MDTPLTVAILAGGAATRLGGRDKGLEPLLGRPLIEPIVATWRARIGDAALIIVANRNLEIYARYAPVVSDATADFRGPLAGVAAALGRSATPLLLTAPVDCPDPPEDLVPRLRAAIEADGAACVVAHDGERRQPLFALYRGDLAQSAAAAAKEGQGVRQWQDAIGARDIDFSDRRRQFHNLNTPADFADYSDAVRSRD